MSEPSRKEKSAAILPSVEQQVHPAVKALLENVIVPALVKQYLTANAIGGEITESNHEQSHKKPELEKPDGERKIEKAKRH
jgi:hypothetical protein